MKLLEVGGLKTYYYLESGGVVKAVDDISFSIEQGEALGLVGESGCGKSTVAFSIMRLVQPPGKIVTGRILLEGEDLLQRREDEMRMIRWKRIAIVFQGAMNALNPVIKTGEQIAEAILLHEKGFSKKEALARAADLLELVGIDRSRVEHYPFEFSGGMKQRAVIAMALALNPSLLIADEPATALDVIVQAQIMALLRDLRRKLGIGMMVITHDLSLVSEICDRIAVMYAGKMAEYVDVRILYKNPLHPYSQGLIGAFPRLKEAKRRLQSIPGSPPDLVTPPPACRFHPRCPYAWDVCRREEPEYVDATEGHYVACHLVSRPPR